MSDIIETKDTVEQQDVIAYYGEEFFGALLPLIADIDITDINCNGRDVWVNHVTNGRYKADVEFTAQDIEKLAYRVSNTENVQFNKTNPELSADLHDLRFHFTHESFSVSGTSVSIRKTPITNRITEESILNSGKGAKEVEYLSEKANEFLKAAVRCRFNSVICGLTGTGKTELIKYAMRFTHPSERIITIEDTIELHLPQIYPEKDIVELKVKVDEKEKSKIDYERAIKACMRMLPTWLLLSEARGKEIKDLIKCVSTGAKIFTTIHTDNARQIPSRMLNMFEDNELSNDKVLRMIYEFVDLGIHITLDNTTGKTIRYIDQIVYFDVVNGTELKCYDLYTVKIDPKGNYIYKYGEMPRSLQERLEAKGFYLGLDWEEMDLDDIGI